LATRSCPSIMSPLIDDPEPIWRRRVAAGAVCGMFRPRTDVRGELVADLLEDEEIEQRLDELGDWEREGDEIQKVFEFEDFAAAIHFVTDVARLADRYDHHPDIDIRWNRVRLGLSTHSEGGLTARDFDIAGEIEQSIG
jgi:4a-hydroxytetrahydrobiopterin dehydratase